MELKQLDTYPKELLDISVENLYTLFPEPTLLHLQGMRPETVFISILLHGNESVGLYVIQELLRSYQNTRLPRSISIFVGNTQAARHEKRMLDHQPDYNRIWPGTVCAESPESLVMQEIVSEMQNRNLFASIDIHNNTGLNPHYACINRLNNKFLQLASLFGPTVVYFLTPKGVQSMAFSEFCPAVTLECGKTTSLSGVAHALEFLDAVLHMKEIPNDPVVPQDIHIFQTITRVKVPQDISFSFTDPDADILFTSELDKMNFSEMPANTYFGKTNSSSNIQLLAFNDDDEEIGEQIFHIEDQKILLSKPMMPAMLTLDETVIRQDCLCYLMERVNYF
ncbi:MAG: M14 family metallopeptidase [Gammaproteobacteria bacterium]